MKKSLLSMSIVFALSGNVFAEESVNNLIGISEVGNTQSQQTSNINGVSNYQPTFKSESVPVKADDVLRQELAKNLGVELEKQNKVQAQKQSQPQQAQVKTQVAQKSDYDIEKGPVVKIKPSENKIIKVAVGMMNKIETPFYKAAVKTSNDGDITVESGVIFVTPKDKNPIGLIIREKGLNETMFSLTLIPEDVPPVMITADLSMNEELRTTWYEHVKEEKNKKKHEEIMAKNKELSEKEPTSKTNSSNVFESTVTGLLKTIAMGGIPNGYQLRDASFNYSCDTNPEFPTYSVDVKQIIEGSKINVNVGVVENKTNSNLYLNESSCYKQGVLAVSAYPNVNLSPGQKTEIYIVEKREELLTDTARKKLY